MYLSTYYYFLTDLCNYLENAHCIVIFYADDLALGSNDPQNAINKLSLCCDHNENSVNIEKTVVQVFQNAGRNRQIDFFYRNVPLTYTKCFVYLGLALSTRLSPYPNRAKHDIRKEEYWGFKKNNADKKI